MRVILSSCFQAVKEKRGIICCIFWRGFWCCPPQTLVEIVIFSVFCDKKIKKFKKAPNLIQKLAKKMFFKLAPKRWLKVLFPKKLLFHIFSTKMLNMTISTSVLGCAAPKRWSKYTTVKQLSSLHWLVSALKKLFFIQWSILVPSTAFYLWGHS